MKTNERSLQKSCKAGRILAWLLILYAVAMLAGSVVRIAQNASLAGEEAHADRWRGIGNALSMAFLLPPLFLSDVFFRSIQGLNSPFTPENAKQLRRIGYSLLALTLIPRGVLFVCGIISSLNPSFGLFLACAFLLAISDVFDAQIERKPES